MFTYQIFQKLIYFAFLEAKQSNYFRSLFRVVAAEMEVYMDLLYLLRSNRDAEVV
jgi:hypothetical protein